MNRIKRIREMSREKDSDIRRKGGGGAEEEEDKER